MIMMDIMMIVVLHDNDDKESDKDDSDSEWF